jgi:hypothetical protein
MSTQKFFTDLQNAINKAKIRSSGDAVYVAMDEDKEWYCYGQRPVAYKLMGRWRAVMDDTIVHHLFTSEKSIYNWEKTLYDIRKGGFCFTSESTPTPNSDSTPAPQYEDTPPYDYVHPSHYKKNGDIETIDMMIRIWGEERVADYCEINAFKYRMRMGHKPNQTVAQEYKKAKWYEDKAKELRKSNR